VPYGKRVHIGRSATVLNEAEMRKFVMSRDPTTLENALTDSLRYESINMGNPEPTHSASSDPSAYVYDDKGQKRDTANIRGAEVQQEAKHHDTVQVALLETKRKLADREAELEKWQSVWNAKQTRLQTPMAQYDWRLIYFVITSQNKLTRR